ncbi:SdpI family protein [Frateuria sp. YIM B11624]|uniref:SdpI family protein n=1 Tax=Frateuria sp. YIM B11624 TaxID=3143185 RepID=UPI003C70F046
MKYARTLWVTAVFLLVAMGVAVWLYPALPALVPSHWNAAGQVNGHQPRLVAVVFAPGMILVLALLTLGLPGLAPRRFGVGAFASAWGAVMLAVQGVVLVLGITVLLVGAGYAVPVNTILLLAVGAFFMVAGNYMGKLRRNFFIGIRTPWTLTSDEVWERTHRLGGWTFAAGGLLIVVSALAHAPVWVSFGLLALAVLVPCVYSLLLYRRLEGRG